MGKDNAPDDKIPFLIWEDRNSFNSVQPVTIDTKGVSVVWKNLCVNAVIKAEHTFRSATHTYKEIIHDVDGCVQPNTLVAIMGASGSGKSTLMSVLASRQPGELVTSGDIRINGKKVQLKHMRRISGYVYQDDLFVSTLTVLEHLHFAAKMKLDRSVSESYRTQIINDLLQDVSLKKCANNRIGSTSYGTGKVNLSGGEQKRLSVATELLTDPPLLFCDEPTTGLDSFSALKLINVMRNLTENRNKTIICSIHQPSEQLFDLFHQVILLYNGRIAFSGTPHSAVDFFRSLGYKSSGHNAAEFLVKSLAILPGQEAESAKQATEVCRQFDKSQYAEDIRQYIEKECCTDAISYSKPRKIKQPSWFYMLYLMLYRDVLAIWRDPTIFKMSLIYKAVLGLLLGGCFMGTVQLTQKGIQAIKGIIFIAVAQSFFPPVQAATRQIPQKMPLFLREYTNNINSPSLFYLSNLISVTPGLLIESLVFILFVYWLPGLKADLVIFAWSVMVNALLFNLSYAYGMILSVATNNYETAMLIILPMDVVFSTLSGIFINLRTVPIYLYWMRYVLWMTLSAETLLILQLADVKDIACPSDTDVPCLKTGAEALYQLDFSSSHFMRNIYTMVLLYIVIHVAAFCIFSVRTVLKTKSKRIKKY